MNRLVSALRILVLQPASFLIVYFFRYIMRHRLAVSCALRASFGPWFFCPFFVSFSLLGAHLEFAMQTSQHHQTFEERVIDPLNGFVGIGLCFALLFLAFVLFVSSLSSNSADLAMASQPPSLFFPWFLRALSVFTLIWALFCTSGFFVLAPNEACAITLFGRYKGVCSRNGFNWINPFYAQQRVSLRRNNFVSPTLKVNDSNGAPIEIAAAIQWRVRDIGQAVFGVDNVAGFVQVNAEAALRAIASAHPYDKAQHSDDEPAVAAARAGDGAPRGVLSLRGHLDEISELLIADLQNRLGPTGAQIESCSITHLAYAPEIASSMLRRQQAEAILQARKLIAKGAADISKETITSLANDPSFDFTPQQKAVLVSNLLVVLCSDKEAAPVVNLN